MEPFASTGGQSSNAALHAWIATLPLASGQPTKTLWLNTSAIVDMFITGLRWTDLPMYYGHLRGNAEYLFKQSAMGGVSHILIDATEVLAAFAAGPPFPDNLRVDTWCGRNYKYGNYSSIIERDGSVRNACEYCFVEYAPEETNKSERKREEAKRRADAEARGQVYPSDLPF